MNSQWEEHQPVVILGLGYVGLTLSVVMAEMGFRVIGVEIRQEIVDLVNQGIPHFFETQMEQRLKAVIEKGKLAAHREIPKNLDARNYIITVGTPLLEDKSIRLDMIDHAAKEIAECMPDDSLVVMRSTVKVGTTRNVVCPIMKETGKKFHLAFCPERTLEGKALAELAELPQIIGGMDKAANLRATQIFQRITPTIVQVGSVETAEMIKLVDNTSRDVIFAYANEIASLCDVVGANVLEVVQAGKKGYPRTNVALPGLVGGPCLTKDSYILDQSVAGFGIRPSIIMEGRKTNEDQPVYVANFLKPLADKFEWPEDMKVSLLGLAFKGKPATDDLRGTMALPVLNALKAVFPRASYWGFDQVVSRKDTKGIGLLYAESIAQALEGAHLTLIVNNHSIFEQFGVSQKTRLMAIPGLVYDFWNTLNIENTQFADGVYYISTGNHRLCLDIIDK